jgi:hypothetical protein
VKPDPLRLSANQKKELFDFIRNTKNKEEYRRAVAIKQKMEGMSYRTIANNLDHLSLAKSHQQISP